MTYDGSLPPADGKSYWWSNIRDAWIPADDDIEKQPDTALTVTRETDAQPLPPILGIDDFYQETP